MRAAEFINEARGHREDPDLVLKIMSMWDEGLRQTAIADALDITPKRVDTILNNHYKDRPNKKLELAKLMGDAEREQMVLDFIDGKTVDAIADRNGVAASFVAYTIVSKIGHDEYELIKKQRHGMVGIKKGKTPEEIEAMANEYAKGKSYPQIAKAFGVNAGTVQYHVTRNPRFADILKQHEENKPKKVVHSPTTTDIHRPGTVGNRRSKGPNSRHTHRMLSRRGNISS